MAFLHMNTIKVNIKNYEKFFFFIFVKMQSFTMIPQFDFNGKSEPTAQVQNWPLNVSRNSKKINKTLSYVRGVLLFSLALNLNLCLLFKGFALLHFANPAIHVYIHICVTQNLRDNANIKQEVSMLERLHAIMGKQDMCHTQFFQEIGPH